MCHCGQGQHGPEGTVTSHSLSAAPAAQVLTAGPNPLGAMERIWQLRGLEALNLLYSLGCSCSVCTDEPGKLGGRNKKTSVVKVMYLPENFLMETYCSEHSLENAFYKAF